MGAPPLDRAEIHDLQWQLALHGYDPGSPDGVAGPRTRAAVRQYQADAGLPVDGEASASVLNHLQYTTPPVLNQRPVETVQVASGPEPVYGDYGYAGDGGPAKTAVLAGPKGIALDKAGNVYLADTESHTIRVIRAKDGTIETVVGDGQPGDGPDGPPLKCRLDRPHGVSVSDDNVLYIGDSNNNRVRALQLP